MKRKLLYAGVILGLLGAQPERHEIAQLIPAEVVSINMEEDVCIRTDTGNEGCGDDLQSAFRDMQRKASGYIYVDTAKWLLMDENSISLAGEAREYLKGNTKVCLYEGDIDLNKVGRYLQIHKPQVRLDQIYEGVRLPRITTKNGSFELS